MSAQVFEARWHRIQRSREQGYEELSDFLGRFNSMGPMVRCGLLRRREEWSEFQRYHGYVPTELGNDYLLYIPDKELILVRQGKSVPLILALQNDPAPTAVFKETYAEPIREQINLADEMRVNAGRDVWRIQRSEQLRTHILAGYLDFRSFTKRTGLGESALLRLELCKPVAERAHDHALALELTEQGAHYLTVLDPWELLMVKPGMELPLFEAMEPEKSEYWCVLP